MAVKPHIHAAHLGTKSAGAMRVRMLPDRRRLTIQILEGLRAAGLRQQDIAAALRKTQPTISRWLRGKPIGDDDLRRLLALAQQHGLDGLRTEDDYTPGDVPVLGYVGAGASVVFEGELSAPIAWAPRPEEGAIPTTTVAVEVRGDSMPGIAEEGWKLYYNDRREPVTDDLIGKLCVVGCADGRVLVKRIFHGGQPGLYDLMSQAGGLERGVQVTWAAKVDWIRPK